MAAWWGGPLGQAAPRMDPASATPPQPRVKSAASPARQVSRAGAAAAASTSSSGATAAALEDSERQPTDPRQLRTPLLDAVRQRGDAVHEVPFHVPGHKRGASMPASLAGLVRPSQGSVLQYDLTEVAGLDYLSSPTGVIQEAQQLAAAAFGADHTWFLVNGCSAGIHAAVVAVTGAAAAREAVESAAVVAGSISGAGAGGTTLLVARNCHLSAFSAMVVAGCEPSWLQPEVDPRFGVAHCVTPGSVQAALEDAAGQGRRVAGVLIVSPTYFGAVADVEGIASVCHSHGVPLLVDEAHGGHFAFLPGAQQQQELSTCQHLSTGGSGAVDMPSRPPPARPLPPAAGPPPSALSCGADLVMQSTHKVLGAMTQAAMLHARGPRVCHTRISRALQTLQSSSPSYLLLASLDAARAQAAAGGAFDEPEAAAQLIRAAVSRCRNLELLDERTVGSSSSVRYFDPLRLTLLVAALGLPGGGFEAAEWLEARHGVVPELATAKTVVLALGPGSTLLHAAAAAAAIQELDLLARPEAAAAGGEHGAPAGNRTAPPPPLSARQPAAAPPPLAPAAELPIDVVMTPRAAYFAATESVAASDALGRVSAELLCPYPPGVPVLLPGERISHAALELLRTTLAAGGAVTGARDGSLGSIEVVVTAAAAPMAGA